jgi:hypothetical protein
MAGLAPMKTQINENNSNRGFSLLHRTSETIRVPMMGWDIVRRREIDGELIIQKLYICCCYYSSFLLPLTYIATCGTSHCKGLHAYYVA